MDSLTGFVTEAVRFFTGVAVAYFYVGLVSNLAQAQVSTSFGDRRGYATAIQQAMSMVILLAIAVGLPELSQYVIGYLQGIGGDSAAVMGAVKGLVKMILTLVLSASMILMVVMAVYNGFLAQVSHAMGMGNQVEQRIVTAGASIGAGIVTMLSVYAANRIIEAFFF